MILYSIQYYNTSTWLLSSPQYSSSSWKSREKVFFLRLRLVATHLEERATHIGGVVQLARPVVVEDLSEHPRMSGNEKINRLE